MALKWIVTHNVSVATKSANPEHLKARTNGANDSTHRCQTIGAIQVPLEPPRIMIQCLDIQTVQANMDIFNFKLSQKEMESLDKATFASEDWEYQQPATEAVK